MVTPNINKILRASPRNCARGAPMGAANYLENVESPLYVQRIQMIDGDYAPDATYWGGPPSDPLWCGFSADGANRVYVRATSRKAAAAEILTQFSDACFIQNPTTLSFDFYEDPGHGWCKVKRSLLLDLGILYQISSYSYQRGDWVFLEEDCDLSLLYDALRTKGIEPKLRRHVADKRSRIRGYDSLRAAQV